jgi:hypothetical protein
VAIHPEGYLMVGKVATFNPSYAAGQERRRLMYLMNNAIIEMYMQMDVGDASDVPVSQHNQNSTSQI